MMEKFQDHLFASVVSLLLGAVLTLAAAYFTSQPATPEKVKSKLLYLSQNAISKRYVGTPTENKIDKIVSFELGAAAEKSIVIAGSSIIEGSPYRWISVFEKEAPSIFDKLIGRSAFFQLTSLTSYESFREDTLQVEKIEAMDIDGDGISEIHIRLHSVWADSTSTGPLILKKSSDGQWVMVTIPSIENTLKSPIASTGLHRLGPVRYFEVTNDKPNENRKLPNFNKMAISEEVWEANHNNNKQDIVTLRNGGNYTFKSHAIRGHPQILVLAFFADGGAVLGPHYAVINVFKIVGHEIKTDDLWNWGHPIYSIRPQRLLDISTDVVYGAGISAHILGDVFFGYTEFEKLREKL